jgi:hypothetical protein
MTPFHRQVLAELQEAIDQQRSPEYDVFERGSDGPIISAFTLRLMLSDISPGATMSDDLVEALQRETEAFVEEVVAAGCKICKARGDGVLRPSDIALYVSRHAAPKPWRRPDAKILRR